MNRRITISMDDQAAERLLALAGSQRKQGDYIAKLVNSVYENQQAGGGNLMLDDLRLRILGLMAELNKVRGRVAVLEQRR